MRTTRAHDCSSVADISGIWGGAGREGADRAGSDGEQVIEVDCDRCVLAGSDACDDCLVSFVIGQSGRRTVAVDAQEARVVSLLTGAGLVPALRHLPRTG